MTFSQFGERVHRVRLSAAADFEIVYGKALVASDGEFDHPQPPERFSFGGQRSTFRSAATYAPRRPFLAGLSRRLPRYVGARQLRELAGGLACSIAAR